MAMFNEVFLTDVFVPDDCLVASPGAGWASPAPPWPTSGCRCRRAPRSDRAWPACSSWPRDGGAGGGDDGDGLADALVADRLGGLVADAHAIAVLGMRSTLRALAGVSPDPRPACASWPA